MVTLRGLCAGNSASIPHAFVGLSWYSCHQAPAQLHPTPGLLHRGESLFPVQQGRWVEVEKGTSTGVLGEPGPGLQSKGAQSPPPPSISALVVSKLSQQLQAWRYALPLSRGLGGGLRGAGRVSQTGLSPHSTPSWGGRARSGALFPQPLPEPLDRGSMQLLAWLYWGQNGAGERGGSAAA